MSADAGPQVPVDGPYARLRVVELGVVIAGPAASAMLADWGAEVVKVEPLEGDPQRGNIVSSYFNLDNRNKRSICVDLKSTRGAEIMRALVADADVFVTNLRPSALERVGLGPDQLRAALPRLVYAIVTGYGLDGSGADRPGYDVGAYWSRSGLAAALVGPNQEPPVPRPGMGDHTASLALVAGIGAALYERERTGRGRVVTSSLLRTGAFVVSSDLAAQLDGVDPRPGMRRAQFNPLMACYQAGDGRWFWLLGLQAERHWPNVLRAVDRTDLLQEERYASFGRLLRHSDEVIAVLDAEFAKLPLSEWAEIFEREDVWWDPVQSLVDLLDDPLVEASGAFRLVEGGSTIVAAPVDFPGSEQPAVRAPEAGEHTEAVLLELGYDWEAISALKDERVIP